MTTGNPALLRALVSAGGWLPSPRGLGLGIVTVFPLFEYGEASALILGLGVW